ncbi:hypothetical protein ACK3TF_004656 [Chlorella vulgaris]
MHPALRPTNPESNTALANNQKRPCAAAQVPCAPAAPCTPLTAPNTPRFTRRPSQRHKPARANTYWPRVAARIAPDTRLRSVRRLSAKSATTCSHRLMLEGLPHVVFFKTAQRSAGALEARLAMVLGSTVLFLFQSLAAMCLHRLQLDAITPAACFKTVPRSVGRSKHAAALSRG